MGNKRKGQLNIFNQPIMLIVLVSIFAIFVFKTLEVNINMNKESEDNDFKTDAINIAEEAIKCAHDDSHNYPYMVSASKLNDMKMSFINGDAPCIRDNNYGWNAEIRDIPTDAEDSGNIWVIGEAQGSTELAVDREYSISLPLAIRYDDGRVNSGVMTINIKDGDLEFLAGRIQMAKDIGSDTGIDFSMSVSKSLSYDVYMKDDGGKKKICQKTEEAENCKTIGFQNLRFSKIDAGVHYFSIRYDQKSNMVVVDV